MSSQAISDKQMVRSQNELIRKNISAISEAQRSEASERSLAERIADRVTAFSGSMLFVYLHVVWFGVWVSLNVGLIHIPHVSEFDRFPFGLLTMIVSLEAIFLSTFVLISQNRMAQQSERRAELDLHVNLLAEQKATKALEMLDQITTQLSTISRFKFKEDPEVDALKVSPEPQDVLVAIKEAVSEEAKEVKQKVEEAVSEITGEMEAVREDVREITGETEVIGREVEQVGEKMETVAAEVEQMKEEIKEKTGEQEKVLVG